MSNPGTFSVLDPACQSSTTLKAHEKHVKEKGQGTKNCNSVADRPLTSDVWLQEIAKYF